jgi:hypothetical protein
MTLLLMEGFDTAAGGLQGYSGNFYSGANTRFNSGYSWGNQNGNTFNHSITASTTVVAGFAAAMVASQSALQVNFLSSGTRHISFIFTGTTWKLFRGDQNGTLLATSPDVPPGWHYFEFKVTISDGAGIAQYRMDGGTTNLINFSGDTKNGGTTTDIDQVGIGTYGGGVGVYIDDIYILNTSGSVNNDFLGDVRIATMMPNGNGNRSQLTGSDGNSTDNYLLVDEQPYSTADYVGSATAGQGDTYTMANLPTTAQSIAAAKIASIMLKSDAGAASAKHVLRRAGTDYFGATRVLSTSAVVYSDIWETDPSTAAAWTETNINAAEAGMEVV